VILSAPTLDRDGETIYPDEWKQPLPEHITFDIDHGMSVATTVGSGTPRIDSDGTLRVAGTYSSIARAQEVRTLVNEGHIKTTSVAFMREKNQKDGTTVRELLNGAFVAVPSNRDALVTSSKAFEAVEEKAGRRNSASDLVQIQMAHDAMVGLGALCDGMGSADDGDGSLDNGTPLTIGGKAATPDADDSIPKSAQAVDAAIDEAMALVADIDVTTLPEPVAQALGLLSAADAACDNLLDLLGVADPDDTDSDEKDVTSSADDSTADTAKGLTADDELALLAVRAHTLRARAAVI
jgi:hypothetical protein